MEIKTPTNTTAMTEKASASVAKKQKPDGVIEYLNRQNFQEKLALALPKSAGIDVDRFVRSAISDFRLNPALQECSVPSVLGFYMQAAMLGLEPSSMLGQCYPVPFYNKNTDTKECQFIAGYRGLLSIARRSGEIAKVEPHVVYEKDQFEITYGLHSDLVHVPFLGENPGNILGAYCVITFQNGMQQYEFMPKHKIDQHRKRSKGSNYGPWSTDYEEMAKKTVFRSMFKWLPISVEMGAAMRADESVVRFSPTSTPAENPEDYIEVDFVAAAPEEGAAE